MWATLAKGMICDLMPFVSKMYLWRHGHRGAKCDSDPCNGAYGLLMLVTLRTVVVYTLLVHCSDISKLPTSWRASRFIYLVCWSATQDQGCGWSRCLAWGPWHRNRPCLRRHTRRCTSTRPSTSSRGATQTTFIKCN